MTSKDKPPEQPTSSKTATLRQNPLHALRQQAEKASMGKPVRPLEKQETLTSEEAQKIILELQTHRIELEMQNEELNRAQEELEFARARYFHLYDLAPVGYFSLNEKGLILEANLSAAALLGVNRAELIKQPITQFIHNEDKDYYYLYRKQILDNHSPDRQDSNRISFNLQNGLQLCELRMINTNGTPLWVNLRETITKDPKGESEHLVILNDISERKQAEEKRVKFEAKNRSIQKTRSLHRMAAAIAHLFNNHLQVIQGNIELALDRIAADAVPREYLLNALRSIGQSSDVSGLLLIYLGQKRNKREPLNLSELCQQSLSRIETTIPSGISIKTNLKSPGPVVYVNASLIEQVLTNLITNAFEAIGDSTGRVKVVTKTVPASNLPSSQVSLVDWEPTAMMFACLEVLDTGPGISEDEMGTIFDPFFTTKFTGRGLGLAVAMSLVKRWGGMISVNSLVGEGSCFSVYLPLFLDEAPRQTELLTEQGKFKVGGVVLLVDDDPALCLITEAILNQLGFSVLVASGGNEAVDLFQKHQDSIDCLLTDLSMPDMDGWETLGALREIKPNLPVILSSGYDEAHVMAGDHDELPQAFLHKPYMKNDLKNALLQVLEDPPKNIK